MTKTRNQHGTPSASQIANTGMIAGDPSGNGSNELATAGAASGAATEVQGAIMVAMRFPRDEDVAYGTIIKACQRPTFQQKAVYSYPRGGTTISGPSVNLAREFARAWRNIRYGFLVVSETEDSCHVRGYAWDMETNTKIEQDASFKTLIYRKNKGWIKPDEREKRELINKHGAIAERNCLLKILPADMVEDVVAEIRKNQAKGIRNDMEQHRKAIVGAFATINVTSEQLESFLTHPLTEITAECLMQLREIYTAIHDGSARWADYHKTKTDEKPKPKTGGEAATMDDLMNGEAVKGEAAKPADHREPDLVPDAKDTPPEELAKEDPPADHIADDRKMVGAVSGEPVESVLVQYEQRIAAAIHLKELDEITSEAGRDTSLNDSQFEGLRDLVSEARRRIADRKGLSS